MGGYNFFFGVILNLVPDYRHGPKKAFSSSMWAVGSLNCRKTLLDTVESLQDICAVWVVFFK